MKKSISSLKSKNDKNGEKILKSLIGKWQSADLWEQTEIRKYAERKKSNIFICFSSNKNW